MTLKTLILITALFLPIVAQPQPALFTPAQSVVQIVAHSECSSISVGSGVIVEPGVVITSAHVVQGTQGAKVLVNGKEYFPSAHILAPDLDLCLLRVPALPNPPISLAGKADIKKGLKVKAIGFPNGLGPIGTSGTISALWRFRGSQLIQSDVITHHGNSGGGLFTEDGRLVGVVTFGLLSYEGLSFSVPASWIPELLNRPWQAGASITLCRPREIAIQDFLEEINADPSNRASWEVFNQTWVANCPNDPEAWFGLGYTLSQRASQEATHQTADTSVHEAARCAYLTALRLKPGYARAWNNLGTLQDTLGENESAIKSFKMAVQLNEDYSLAWLNLGSAYINARKYEEAAQALRRGLERCPDEAPSWARLSFCETNLNQLDDALRHLKVALALDPMQTDWWVDLAKICKRSKRKEEFEISFQFLRDRLPTFAQEVSLRVRAPKL